MELTRIVKLIETSKWQNIPHFLYAVLQSRSPDVQRLAMTATDESGLGYILNLLKNTDKGRTVAHWAIHETKGICVREIKAIARVEGGLHFNVSNAQAGNFLTEFRLDSIARTCKKLAPTTWDIIQTLLDANGDAHQ